MDDAAERRHDRRRQTKKDPVGSAMGANRVLGVGEADDAAGVIRPLSDEWRVSPCEHDPLSASRAEPNAPSRSIPCAARLRGTLSLVA